MFYFIVIGLAVSSQIYSQCEVLNPNIAGTYTGNCKKGLAHGKGIAKGIDTYEGQFMKGVTHGSGIYIWANGDKYNGEWKKGLQSGFGEFISATSSKDSKKGIWKNGQFIKAQQHEKLYEVENTVNIKSVACRKIAEGDRIYIRFKNPTGNGSGISNLKMVGSGGFEVTELSNAGFESANFPFSVDLSFYAPSVLSKIGYEVKCKIKIYEPGTWEVVVNY